MREILFRGQTDKGEWVQGDLFQVFDDGFFIHDRRCHSVKVIPETIGQYTGLTDKNGTKIFEGDIVDILTENEEIGVVAYNDGGFLVEADSFCVTFQDNINGTDVEIIGNIHDNPELLKECEGKCYHD